MTHTFKVSVAEEVGVNAAIILGHMEFWCERNRSNDENFHDGLYWTYDSNRSLRERYTYMGKSAIEGAIAKLESMGYIRIGNYGKDRTRWFAVTESGYALLRGETASAPPVLSLVEDHVQDAEEEKKKNEKKDPEPPYEEIIAYLNEMAGTRLRHQTEPYRRLIRGRLSDGYTLDDFKTVIRKKSDEWKGTEMAKYLRPQTLFTPSHFDQYLNQPEGRTDAFDEFRSWG